MLFEFRSVQDKPIAVNSDHIVCVYPGKTAPLGQAGVHTDNTVLVMSVGMPGDYPSKEVRVLGSYDAVLDELAIK